MLRRNDVRLPHDNGVVMQLDLLMTDPRFKVSGQVWEESRDHWREEVREYFPVPEEDADANTDDDMPL